MNAVRMRKEGAIQSAEEARIIKELSLMEHAKKENEFVAELREMVERKAQEKQQPFKRPKIGQ
jgi:hypothetical protein